MTAFSRTFAPNEMSEPAIMGMPLVSRGRAGVSQSRGTTAVGIAWTEQWPIIDHQSQAGRTFIGHVRYRLRSPDSFTITPYRYQGTPAGSVLAAGATGTVNGANQTGSMIALAGFGSDGTVPAGNYLTGIGSGAVFLIADLTISGGAGAAHIDPPIFDLAHAPANGATVTLNGPVNAIIANRVDVRKWLATVQQTEYVNGLTLTFAETCE